MSDYVWATPQVLGTADIPQPREPVYTDILRQVPYDKALVLEFPSRKTRTYGSNLASTICRERLGFRISVRSVNTDDGRFLLLVWRRRECDRQVGHVADRDLPIAIGTLELVVVESAQ